MAISNWSTWHDEYDDPDSELAARMLEVRRQVAAVVAGCPPGPVTVVSICGGQGREVIGALADHPRRGDVRGRLVELDEHNAGVARAAAGHARLDAFEVVHGDASVASSYDGLPPVDLVVISGLFGHLDDDDQQRVIAFLGRLCRPGGHLVWTFFLRDEGRADKLRRFFAEGDFDEVVFERLPGDEYSFSVALSRYAGEARAFDAERIFEFGSSRRTRTDPSA